MNFIHYFNPGHENAILNRLPSYTEPASIATLMRELSSLPAWYAPSDNLVLVGEEYDIEYHEMLQNMGLSLPNLVNSKNLKKYSEAEVCMWGISPQAIRIFEAYNKNYSLSLTIPKWYEKYIYLSGREIAADVLADLKSISSDYESIQIPTFCTDITTIDRQVIDSQRPLLAKSPYSSSGRGLLWLPPNGLTRVEHQILQGMLKKQGRVSLEPVYDKKIDFAMEFLFDGKGGISFEGYSLFSTNVKGGYQGNYLCPQYEIIDGITQFIDLSILDNTKEILLNLLTKTYGSIYKGCIGVDMMVVFEQNLYIIHPCVEINMRYNMGFLAIKLFDNFIFSNSRGQYFLDFDSSGNLKSEHEVMLKKFPLIVDNGKIKSGYLSLCPVNNETKYKAYVLIQSLE